MCAERMQRILTAIVLGFVLMLWAKGYIKAFVILQTFVIIMMLIWAFTDFCPSLWFFRKIFPPCKWGKNE